MNIQPTASSGAPRLEERSNASEAPGTGTAATAKANNAPAPAAGAKQTKAADGVEPTSADIKTALEKLNHSMTESSQDLQFSVDEDSKQTVVKLIDRNTHEVLRQMPTKEALEIAKSLDKAMGKLIDQRA
ncbi:flagellar protein FlaG [Massilia sp. S19_KUP03_FR1]|uniref:flagellar protein FlaG n=1 Tax=Massilia sp. S19_KUP03_FR1 TaxID=3025503 RepID=UPI002FCD8F55